MTRRREPRRAKSASAGAQGPAPQTAVAEPAYRVRYAIFEGRGGVFHPAGKSRGDKRRGFPTQPPPPYEPPVERVLTTATYGLARDLVRELRLEHGEAVVVHVEPIETTLPPRRPRQTSMADLADDWPSAPPARRWMGE